MIKLIMEKLSLSLFFSLPPLAGYKRSFLECFFTFFLYRKFDFGVGFIKTFRPFSIRFVELNWCKQWNLYLEVCGVGNLPGNLVPEDRNSLRIMKMTRGFCGKWLVIGCLQISFSKKFGIATNQNFQLGESLAVVLLLYFIFDSTHPHFFLYFQ